MIQDMSTTYGYTKQVESHQQGSKHTRAISPKKGTYVRRLTKPASLVHEHMFIGHRTYVHRPSNICSPKSLLFDCVDAGRNHVIVELNDRSEMNTEHGYRKQVESNQQGSKHTPAILMSKLRSSLGAAWEQAGSSLEYTYSMLMTTFLRPFSSKRAELERRLAANEITARCQRDYGSSLTILRLVVSMLLMLTLGSVSVWGQTDYSGTYYIGNYNNKGYNVETPANNYYLVPAANPQQSHQIDAYYSANYGSADGDSNQPFLTTYKTNKDANSVWILEASGESGFYYIKHQSTGRYVIYDPVFPGDNSRRKSMHLTTGDPNDKAKFEISVSKPGYAIRPKSESSGNRYFNVAGGNIDFYYSNGPTTGTATYYNGLVGLYTDAADRNGIWFLEIPKPTISQDPTTLKISMSCELTGVDIRYTTNGTEPTKTSTLYEGEFLPEIGTSVFKAKAFNSSGDVASAMTTFELTKNAAPSISLNWGDKEVTISSTVDGGTIFYTTNGNNPTVSSSVYSGPISFSKPTTFKAIVGKVGYAPSTVTTRNVIKVVTPTIYDNGKVAIAITTATTGASIYYTTDGSTPTRSSSPYTAPLTNMEGKTIKAIAVKADNFDSDVATYGPVSFSCAQPIIRRTGADNFTITCSKPQSGVTIYYTTNGNTPSTSDSHVASGEAVTFNPSQLPFTVKAIAVADGFTNSSEASLTITNDGLSGSGTPADPYQIALDSDVSIFATKVNTGGEASASFIVTSNINASGASEITTPFTGTFDGNGYTISNLGHALFNTVSGGTVKNVILDAVSISSGTNVGSIANEAIGTSANKASIYNCGVLSGSISGSGYVGSIVGKLGDDSNNDNSYARVINCYSYATIGGGSSVGGIVGYNSFASAANNLRTMVMNCMYYGKITGGSNKAPIYNGQNITNVGTNGLANYNYYFSGCTFTGGIDTYNCALAADERYLTRFEFYRRMLNSNGELAAWYATGSTENRSEMYKWILLPSSYGTEHPFPVLAPQGIYPSVVNFDAENAEDIDDDNEHRNEGRKLTKMGGSGTHQGQLAVTIQMGSGGNQFSAPSGAGIKSGETFPIYLNITDKDYKHFNYNYGKVQLPYYNDYCTGNYTGNRVVTGWKIVSVSGGTTSYSTGDDVEFNTDGSIKSTPYNFADRKCTDKDLYSVSGRVFSQGAYWDVPDGVTSITIEPYWGKAAYLCDQYWNVVYSKNHQTAYNVTTPGVHYTNGTDYFIEGTWQKVYNSLDNAVNALSSNASHSVYDYAVVLVGNYHLVKQAASIKGGTLPFTVMSTDFDHDNEPDYSFILQFSSRQNTAPIRFDFINIPGLGMAQKSYEATSMPNVGIFKPGGWFEITNTATILLGQFEYDRGDKVTSPLILHGGIIEQIVSNNDGSSPLNKTQYIHMGSNVWLANFSPGIHQDRTTATKHVPVSVTGGEYQEFHLTGMYRADASISDDNAECYIHGGKFGEITGTGLEGIGHPTNHTNGNITWVIDQADITNFFGGGINAAKPSQGNIYTKITNSDVTLFCGGPKFGDMQTGKTVTTKATDCTFGTFFGAGYGGNSYNRFSPTNKTTEVNYSWNTWINANYTCAYSSDADKNGISTEFAYEFIPMSGGMTTNVARLFVNYLSFSLATTGSVTSTLTGCKVTGNFYGGGSLGKVNGNVTSTLTNCTLEQSAFGAGFSATLPTVEVMATGGFSTEPRYDPDGGVYSQGVFPGTETYRWEQAQSPGIDKTNHILYTTADLSSLGVVTGKATLTINGTTTVAESVYGGGEESAVNGDTQVTINGGSVNQSVYGGGCEADVKGNTNVSMTDGYIFNGIFGGGLSGSVGTFTRSTAEADVNIYGHTTHDGCLGKPVSCAENTGKCTVVVSGGQIGPIEVATIGMNRPASQGGPVPEGWVWGGGRGKVESPNENPDVHFTAYVGSTDVTIKENAFILESIIGGGEFGRVLGNTKVNIEGGQIGVGANQTEDGKPKRYPNEKFVDPNVTPITNENALAPCSHYPYGKVVGGKTIYETYDPYADEYKANHSGSLPTGLEGGSTDNASDGKTWIGCVFGGGSGYFPYKDTDANGQITKYGWVESAGWVEGNTEVFISGGHILSNVYGANEYTNVKGKSTVTMTGGTIGVPLTKEQFKNCPQMGHLFGGGKGDPRTYFNKRTNVESVEINISGGIIYGSVYGGGEDGHVIGNVTTTISQASGKTTTIGCGGLSGNDGNVFGGGKGSPTALTAGVIAGNVKLNITGGTIWGSAYGGGQIASVGTSFETPTSPNYGKMQEGNHGNLTVSLTGGTIHQNVYGGCMGTNANEDLGVTEEFAAKLGISKNVSVELNKDVEDPAKGCVVLGNIFGCNNVNSSPEGTSTVHIYKTQRNGASRINNTNEVTNAKVIGTKDANGEFVLKTFDVQAVYGGGNLAAYTPKDENGSTNVIIDGCGRTSIGQVYGGGNAASTPATNVLVNGTFEIGELFGGGNGKDAIVVNNVSTPNPGANVGYKDYHLVEDDPTYASKEVRTEGDAFATYRYGTGLATVNIKGGTIHRVFGGSNTKGNVRRTALTMLEELQNNGIPVCEFHVDEAYGGGKSAPMDAEAKLLMACVPGLKEVYGGAEAADIHDDVTLTITNGKFDRVFGGNNISGTISGKISVNIEETGCKPIVIGELYGGGNLAAYSVYGYKEVNEGTTENPKIVWKPRTSLSDEGTGPSTPYVSPQVNVKSFTSIGAIYGGGYGEEALMIANPTVNISESVGDPDVYPPTGDADYEANGFKSKTITLDEGKETEHTVTLYAHTKGNIGVIGDVFGGGNAAQVMGNTSVNIGTAVGENVYLVKAFKTGATLPDECYTKNGNDYVKATGTAEEGKTYYRKYPVVGVDIRGNVYGGGNNAEVTGNTNVVIGKKNENQ